MGFIAFRVPKETAIQLKKTKMKHKINQQAALRHFVYRHMAAALIFIFALAGCTVNQNPVYVKAQDPQVFIPSLGTVIDLDDGKQGASHPHSGSAIEFGYTKVKGGADQIVNAGLPNSYPPLVVNNMPFPGQQQVRDDFDINYADISFRYREILWEPSLFLDLSWGVGLTSLGLAVSSPTQRATEHFSSYGPQGGVALVWCVLPGTSLHWRITDFWSDSSIGITSIQRQEIYIEQAIGKNMALRAGRANWFTAGAGGLWQSDFEANASGSTLGLDFNF